MQEFVEKHKARVVKRGTSISDYNSFIAQGHLAPDIVQLLQGYLGFPHMGYGCWDIRQTEDENGEKITTWICSGSCD